MGRGTNLASVAVSLLAKPFPRRALRMVVAFGLAVSTLPLTLLVPPSAVRAQETWVAQTSNTTKELHGIAAIDAQTAWAVGFNRTILKTTNGGTTWTTQSTDLSEHLLDVAAVDANTAWAVGTNGTIVKTTDGGATWPLQSSGFGLNQNFHDVAAVDANTAWAVGLNGKILRTTDGGTGWVNLTTSPTTDSIQGLAALDANTAWIGTDVPGSGKIHKTINGGATWVEQVNLC